MTPSLFHIGRERLLPLCEAMGFGDRSAEIEQLFRELVEPWGLREGSPTPSWPSDVGDDHTPFEFSVALLDRPELRLLVEPLDPDAPSLHNNARATRELLERLASRYALNLDRLERVWDLFVPPEPEGRFAVWLGAVVSSQPKPGFKIYFNPDARGWIPMRGPALIEESLDRLGMSAVWPLLGQRLGRRGRFLDEFKYISLDLAATAEARIKIYVRHRAATAEDLRSAVQGVSWYRTADLDEFLERIAPAADSGARRCFDRRGIQTCFSFVEGDPEPNQVTTHFPINSYAESDAIVRDRVLSCLSHFGLPSDAYHRVVEAVRNRPLEAGIGMHSYVSLRCQRLEQRRLTIYLPAEVYRPGHIAQLGPSPAPRRGDEIVFAYECRRPITVHPLLSRIQRRAADAREVVDVLSRLGRAFTALTDSAWKDPDERLGGAFALGLYHRQADALLDLADLRSYAPPWDPPDGAAVDNLARQIEHAPADALAAIWRGAERAANAVDACLDDLYAACVSTPSSADERGQAAGATGRDGPEKGARVP